jgi:SepF-like predicted cell division protein (DUF552 family)
MLFMDKDLIFDELLEEDILEGNFLKVEEDNLINLKFHKVNENIETRSIIKDLKENNNILFIDLREILEDTSNLRIFVNKIKRISESLSITMKLYGGSWLIILPKDINFYVNEE